MGRPAWCAGLRLLTAALCGYECGAILIDNERIPTFSRIAGRHRWVSPVLLGALALHLWWPISK